MPKTPARPPLRFGRYDYGAFATMFCYAACSLAIPMTLIGIGKELGFPIDDDGSKSLGGFLQMGRSVAMVAAMLFCGVAAARLGKTWSLGLSLMMMGAGIGLCAVAPFYGILLVGMAVAGLGEGVLEGLATPYVQDLHPDEPGRYLNFAHSFWSVGTLATVLGLGALLQFTSLNWRWLLGGVAALSLVPMALLLWPRRRPEAPAGAGVDGAAISVRGTPRPQISARDVGRHTKNILKRPYFWLFFGMMFFAGGGEFSTTFWMPVFIETVYKGSPWQCGVATACFAAGMIVGRMGWGVLIHQSKLRRLLIGSGMGAIVVSLGFPLLDAQTTPLWGLYALLVLAGVGAAPLWPSIQSYCADRIPELDTTMLFVMLSCAGIPGCGFHSWFIGVVGDAFGMQAAFFVPPISYAIMTALLLIDRAVYRRERRAAA